MKSSGQVGDPMTDRAERNARGQQIGASSACRPQTFERSRPCMSYCSQRAQNHRKVSLEPEQRNDELAPTFSRD